MNHFVIRGNICYSKDANTLITIHGGYIVCRDGVSCGVFRELPDAFGSLPVTDYGDGIIVPGLVDLHTHAPQYPFRGLGMDLELLDWLNIHAFPEEAKYHSLEYAEISYGHLVQEMKRGPNTRFCIFATRHVPATLLLMDKLEKSGLVTMVGKVNMDRNSHTDLQETDARQSLQDTVSWLESCMGRYKNTTPILTPRFIPSCTDELMAGLGELQRRFGLPVQSHLSENSKEMELMRKLCPEARFYGDAYGRFGLFGGGAPTVMAHCVWSCEEEIGMMKENRVFAAHCPQSNINLASGIAPIRRFLDSGIKVGLGSDVAGGCHFSIFRAMSDAIGVSKLHWRLVNNDEKPLSVAEAFYLGTAGGGAFFGKTGSFEPGYEFDAVVIDDGRVHDIFHYTLSQRLERIIHNIGDWHIRAKYARGKQIAA